MNRQCYRLVFNKAKGRLVVASEAATTDRHDGTATPRRRTRCPAPQRRFELGILRPLTWSTLLALGLVTLPAHAQIAARRAASAPMCWKAPTARRRSTSPHRMPRASRATATVSST